MTHAWLEQIDVILQSSPQHMHSTAGDKCKCMPPINERRVSEGATKQQTNDVQRHGKGRKTGGFTAAIERMMRASEGGDLP